MNIKIRSLIREEKADFMAIQETKLTEVDRFLWESLWGGADVNWAWVPSEGSSGGIISLWNSTVFTLSYTFSGKGFLGVCRVWNKPNTSCNLVNVFAPCNFPYKKQLWEALIMSKMGFGGGLWCVVGKFNSVKSITERREMRQNAQVPEMNKFQEFIE